MVEHWARALDEHIDGLGDVLTTVRRHIHEHPELSGEEFQTTFYLADRLNELGMGGRLPPSERGLIVDSEESAGLRVALRADMDALPLHDEKEVSYRSKRDGVAHACGHDAHATMLLGAISALYSQSEALPWPVSWRAVFQPAEETMQGAREMIAAGAAEGIDAAIALHVDPETPLGAVALREGFLTASCETLEVTITGEGGHAARPHHTKDPIAIATQFVNAIYQFIPRAVDSRHPVVVSFGMIRGGANANVIPETVRLSGTVRTLGGETAAQVRERILAIADGLAQAGASRIDCRFTAGAEAVVNDPVVTRVCHAAASELLGPETVMEIPLPSMGSEDFSAYLQHAPGCLVRLGIASGPATSHHLHSPLFDIDERALVLGAKLLARCAVRLAEPR